MAWRTLLAVMALATIGALLALTASALAQGGGAPAGTRQAGPGPVAPPGAMRGTPGMPGRDGGAARQAGAPMGQGAQYSGGERPRDAAGSAGTMPIVIVAAVISIIAIIAALGLRKKE